MRAISGSEETRRKRPRALRVIPAALGLGLLVIVGFFGLCFYTPQPPAEWMKVSLGMSRPEVLAEGAVDPGYSLPIKSLDQQVKRSENWLYGGVTYWLRVRYSEEMKVNHVVVECETERFRLWRRRVLVRSSADGQNLNPVVR